MKVSIIGPYNNRNAVFAKVTIINILIYRENVLTKCLLRTKRKHIPGIAKLSSLYVISWEPMSLKVATNSCYSNILDKFV